MRRLFGVMGSLVAILALIFSVNISMVAALTREDLRSEINQTPFYKRGSDSTTCSTSDGSSTTTAATTPSNLDYAGRPILTDGQLTAIQQNQSFYEKSASTNDIPWQLIAVIHLKEHGLERSNPSNGQGVYQFYDKHGGPYPTGPISDSEFQRQTDLAAQFIKGKAASNYPENKTLTASSSATVIKDTLFSYNGRAGVYSTQARNLGYNANEGYEGSPYVMNKADSQRDPDVSPKTWGQVKSDNGPIEYPANNGYGAFVIFASLAGIGTGGCSSVSGPVRQKIAEIAQQELALWNNGTLSPGSGYLKYSNNRHEDWCADFASWVYNQAGAPLTDAAGGNVSSVDSIKQIGIKNGRYHEKTGYTPQIGDIVIREGAGASHVNIVISVNPSGSSSQTMEVIGGNQGGNRAGFDTSKVSQYTDNYGFDLEITGYVSPE